MLNIGTQAPHFTLDDPDGNPFSLDSLVHDRLAVLLIFLRHLG